MPGPPMYAPTVITWMMLPPPCFPMRGATSCERRSGPFTFTAWSLSQYSCVICATGIGVGLMPALFTSTSMRPKRSYTASTIGASASHSDM